MVEQNVPMVVNNVIVAYMSETQAASLTDAAKVRERMTVQTITTNNSELSQFDGKAITETILIQGYALNPNDEED